jgi:4-amino-4-deoxy-L-arabinose transferase-like glycosyltransferase
LAIVNPHEFYLMIKNFRTACKKFIEKYSLAVFYLLILVIVFAYYYHIVLFSPPQSVHRWRQTDSASMTINFYQHGMHFFKPEVHHLTSDNNTSGYAAAEAPLLYYLIALLYKIFGPHDYIFRIVNTLIFLVGLGALFKISRHFLHDFIAAAFVPLLIFVSPAMAYYGNNFLTDSTALALVFLGWWQYIRYLDFNRYSYFIWAIVFFSLAGLLKATMTISLFAVGGLALLWHLHWFHENKKQLFPRAMVTFVPIITGLVVILAWYLYAIWFNRLHDSKTFLTTIMPWWDYNAEDRYNITLYIKDNLPVYFSQGIRYAIAASLMLTVIFFKHIPNI